ncbi:hypothetical protein [Streptomyces canus]|uniref:hypothetical protein n=1 Tax=Streptomyces canus TaxID=58343 RepID=UPI002DDAD8B9|nr:hypothetical protein [Streptomyces canus]WSD82930.1 hypothetical protein OG925_00495 [Streptomyces canus]WSD91905.1 hypothetical protein OG925_49985 [Streptomyces canus]WSD92606.1 hypothetical protein OG925_50975 [Streptomyces canus]
MQAETLAALMGLGGAVVGAGLSTGAVIWQQRRTAHEAERVHLLGLAEAAANEVIRLSYELQDHCAKRGENPSNQDPNSSAHYGWLLETERLNRLLEQQALRFANPEVRYLLEWCHAEIRRDPEGVAQEVEWPSIARYATLCQDLRTVMGTVLRRQPFPRGIWVRYPHASPPS